jgi:hypothetical protein
MCFVLNRFAAAKGRFLGGAAVTLVIALCLSLAFPAHTLCYIAFSPLYRTIVVGRGHAVEVIL